MTETTQGEASSATRPAVPGMHITWPNLIFHPSAWDQLHHVRLFLDTLDEQKHPKANAIRREFMNRMDYLNDYGGPVDDNDARRRFQVHVRGDSADMSFAVTWLALDVKTGEYRTFMNGALIWHGGPNDPFCVSLTPQWWGIHT